MSANIRRVLFILLVVVLTSAIADAGWVEESSGGETTYYGKGKIKTVSGNPMDGTESWYLIDAKSGKITIVNLNTKTYATGTPEDLCEVSKAMIEEMIEEMNAKAAEMMPKKDDMEAMLSQLSPEQRAMIEEQMKGVGGSGQTPAPDSAPRKKVEVSVIKAGSGGKIVGHPTTKYRVMVDGVLQNEVWIANDLSPMKEMKKLDLDRIADSSDVMEQCMGDTDDGMGYSDIYSSSDYKKLTERGWVMKETAYFLGANPETISEVVRLEKRKIPASEFKIPAGTKKISLRDMMRALAGGMQDGQE